jgi:hypothetical protein
VQVDTRMADPELTAIKRAADFSVASTAIYELLAHEIVTYHASGAAGSGHGGALRLTGFQSDEVALLLPICRQKDAWYPVTGIIQSL